MRDGSTEQWTAAKPAPGFEEFCQTHRAQLVIIGGAGIGQTFEIDSACVVIGRGPGVSIAIANPRMSRQHARIEFVAGAFRIEDLGSTNGLIVSERRVSTASLHHGDRIEVAGQTLQWVIEQREVQEDEAYEIVLDA